MNSGRRRIDREICDGFKVIGCYMQFWNASRFTNSHQNYLWKELLKVVDLDLEKCLCVCRVSELRKEQNKAIEATESINAVQIRSMKVSQRKSAR